MKPKPSEVLYWGLATLPIAAFVLLYNRIPDTVYSTPRLNILIGLQIPGLLAITIVNILPRYDIKYMTFSESRSFRLLSWLIQITFILCQFIVMLSVTKGVVVMPNAIFSVIGLLIVITGSQLPKIKQNDTIGFKSTWTLKDERVWQKTHELAGVTWIVGGLLLITMMFASNIVIFLGLMSISISFIVVIPFVYSYSYYKKLRRYTINN